MALVEGHDVGVGFGIAEGSYLLDSPKDHLLGLVMVYTVLVAEFTSPKKCTLSAL